MNILVAVEDLRTGGAQTFALRLAQALHIAGHQVHLYDHYAHLVNTDLVRQLVPNVTVISYGASSPVQDWLLRKIEGLGRRLGRTVSLRENKLIAHLRKVIRDLQPDVVNSHTIKADYAAAKALEGLSVPLVITMHGCYELFLHKADSAETVVKGSYALQQAKAVVYLTAKNLEIFNRTGVRPLSSLLHQQIYNGFDGSFSVDRSQHTRAALGIENDAKVFGMVARGIPEKGWKHAINSFLALVTDFPKIHLVLVGESDYLTKLKTEYPHSHLHFTGFSRNPIDWVDLFDVGLLPSYFHAESLPNSVAEYLSCGKPVIASRIGEVPAMLESVEGPAGVILDQANWQLSDPNQLTEAMRAYLINPALLAEHKRRAVLAFEKFRMQHCLAAYENLFARVKAGK
ncbi:glycosyltransferase family 4 protein [Hymenobacter sp. BT664]|uniref:Glycosyltransferase family 4 protein n=1 Tax=Hymenobacter montanus TaxID=2771359 RepID=A0A927B957_9BACT|nr:glycosyltransferase family 4 protein [Hymenobacter montanus]MBD2766415.1 glycosyltransferase family 4 protein [Hymenobacter montanus]